MSSSYWTSGVNFGTENSTSYGWCSTGKMVKKDLWVKWEPMIPELQHCVALTKMEDEPELSGLETVSCAFILPVICQFA